MNNFKKYVEYIKNVTNIVPKTAVVLGSGLGGFADKLTNAVTVPYNKLDGFPVSTVDGHNGCFVFGYIKNTPVMVMSGRVHYYEGYTPEQTVRPVRTAALMGCKNIILTNAAGGINKNFKAGDLMVIDDHISLFVPSPLIGRNYGEFGERFPDMTYVYDNNIKDIIFACAKDSKTDIKRGVYVQLGGPNYETPAEIKMLSALGADAVGMSTVGEAIAAKHAGMRIGGISLISNMAAGINPSPLSHIEVKDAANKAAERFNKLLEDVVCSL